MPAVVSGPHDEIPGEQQFIFCRSGWRAGTHSLEGPVELIVVPD